jgi:hypothetical protein
MPTLHPLRLGIVREAARAEVERSDRGIRARIRQFFDVEWGDPPLYDTLLSTGRITVEAGADLLCHLLRRPEWQPTEASRTAPRDAALAARVRAALKAAPETTRLTVRITARAGRLELAGTVETEAGREPAAPRAGAQPGVTGANNALTVMKFPRW